MNLARLDWSPQHRPSSPAALVLATVLSLAGSIGADALLVLVGTHLFPATRGYAHFRFSDYATLTAIGVLVACVAWPIAARVTSSPRWLFLRLAILVTLGLWIPEVGLLVVRHQPARAVAVLMTMHLAIAVVTYNLLVRIAPVREHSAPGSTTRAGAPAGPPDTPEEPLPELVSGTTGDATARRLATALSVLVGVEFVIGIAALFAVPYGRPSEWTPAKGATLYLLHAIIGFPLALGAVALLLLVREADRTLRVTGWIGFGGVAIAGIGGVLAVSHPLRLLGMACMFVGPVTAGLAYLIPLLDRMPAEAPRYN
jgi:hypothetical protein